MNAYNFCTRCGKHYDNLGIENCEKCGGKTDLFFLTPEEFASRQKKDASQSVIRIPL